MNGPKLFIFCSLLLSMSIFPIQPLSAEQLQLVAKQRDNWQPRPDKGHGEIDFSRTQALFSIWAKNLRPNRCYALIQHSNHLNKKGFIIARFNSDNSGQIRDVGKWDLWEGKIWLVCAEDVRGQSGDRRPDRLTGWHPNHYLFEGRVL